MRVRIKIMRIFDHHFKTTKYDMASKTDDMFLKYFFQAGGFETIAIWKVKLK